MLIVLALIVLAITIAAVLHRRLGTRGAPDLGWVSERWLAEYRADASRPSR